MMLRVLATVALMLILVHGSTLVNPSADESSIVRLPAAAFRDVPEAVRAFIAEHGCLVPQPADRVVSGDPPVNVVRGEFAQAGQIDWAVLCSRQGESAIFVLWGGPSQCPTPLAAKLDRDFLQDMGFTRQDFSREVIAARPEQVRATYKYHAEPAPEVHHDTIEDVFVNKASWRYYCEAGAWRELIGAD